MGAGQARRGRHLLFQLAQGGEHTMSNFEQVEILLAEDSDTDAEMTLRALNEKGIANSVTWVKDGESALDFIYYRGSYAERANGHPKVILLDLKMPRVTALTCCDKSKPTRAPRPFQWSC